MAWGCRIVAPAIFDRGRLTTSILRSLWAGSLGAKTLVSWRNIRLLTVLCPLRTGSAAIMAREYHPLRAIPTSNSPPLLRLPGDRHPILGPPLGGGEGNTLPHLAPPAGTLPWEIPTTPAPLFHPPCCLRLRTKMTRVPFLSLLRKMRRGWLPLSLIIDKGQTRGGSPVQSRPSEN